MDFKIDIDENRKFKILQLTDMQIIDGTQQRYEGRLTPQCYEKWNPSMDEENIYSHMRYLTEKTKPDLIIITGDMIYGEFDDSGESLKRFINFTDSLEIPWAVTFGNHDNESKMGIDWQCKMIENAKYSLFRRGSVFGNSNYSIGLFCGGKLKRLLFMVDTNGCGDIGIEPGIRDNQLEWIKNEIISTREEYGKVPSFMFMHEPTDDFSDAYISAGYQREYDADEENYASYVIGEDVPAVNGDFGTKHEPIYACCRQKIMPFLKEMGFDGVFAGHCHKINTSVMYNGIRFTFGYKTGYYDYHDEKENGGTLITIDNNNGFSAEHIRYEKQQVK